MMRWWRYVPESNQEEEAAEENLNGNEPSKVEGSFTAANTSVAKENELDEDIKVAGYQLANTHD